MRKKIGKTAALTLAALGALALPGVGFASERKDTPTESPMFVGTQRRFANTDSAILVVDTGALSIKAKNPARSGQEHFEEIAVRQLARLQHTYSSWAEKNDELMGSLRLKLQLDEKGAVAHVESLATHIPNASFTSVVMTDVSGWKFPNSGLESAEITIPLLFVAKGMDPNTIVQWERKMRNRRQAEAPATDERVRERISPPTISDRLVKSQPSPNRIPNANPLNSVVHLRKPNHDTERAAVVKTKRAVILRQNPQFSAKEVQALDSDTQLRIIEAKGDWLKVKAVGGSFTGFVRKEFVSPINQ